MATFNEFWTNARNRIAGWLGDPTDPENRALAVREYSNNMALSFFEGAQAPVLKIDPRNGIDDNIFVNYPEMIVDKGVLCRRGVIYEVNVRVKRRYIQYTVDRYFRRLSLSFSDKRTDRLLVKNS